MKHTEKELKSADFMDLLFFYSMKFDVFPLDLYDTEEEAKKDIIKSLLVGKPIVKSGREEGVYDE